MGLPRTKKFSLSQKASVRSSVRSDDVTSLSQPIPSTSAEYQTNLTVKRTRKLRGPESSPDRLLTEEENHLVSKLIKYIFSLDRGKQIINKSRIIKNILNDQGQLFNRVISKTKTLLSKIFGFQLVELEGNKYILVNEIHNNLPHIQPFGTEGSQQVLLFLVLTHIFMQQETCTEESLWNFLTSLNIPCSENECHSYFGNVKNLITEVFVTRKYLNKTTVEENDLVKVEFKWGPRAEHEFSRRASLEFVSQVYNGCPINSWPLQYKTILAREESNKS